jgi:hypothetical protein
MSIQISVTTAGEVINDLTDEMETIGRQALEDIHEFLYDVHNRAVTGIQSGPASGKIYQSRSGRMRGGESSVMHQASAPGEYPMSDLGELASGIFVDTTPTGGSVYTTVPHGRYLEMKDPRRGGRPWLTRAWNEALAWRRW